MTYSGNPALTPDVRQRILTTFEQTLDLAEQGSRKEAILGCDFILRMDPRFQPARDLLAQLNAATGPLDVAAYRGALDASVDAGAAQGAEGAAAEGAPAPPPMAAEAGQASDKARDADGLFEDLDELDLGDEPPPPSTVDDLENALAEKLARRDFSGVAHLADRAPQELVANPRVSAVVETAASRRESAPYVQKFLESARQAVDAGDVEGARSFLDKAHQLDPTHPGLQPLLDLAASRQRSASEASSGAAPEPPPEPHLEPADELSGLDLSAPEEEAPLLPPVERPVGQSPSGTGSDSLELEPPPHLDSPQATPPPLASPPSAAASTAGTARSEGAERIAGLLAEGQTAFDQGQYQTAIDAWSRIFLIDVDHAEASRRIEEARRLKAEQERKAEELFHDAVGRLEAGDSAGAQAGLQQVLALQPGHLTAREYLEQLNAGGTPVAPRGGARRDTGPFDKPDLAAGGPAVAAPASGPVAVEDPSLPALGDEPDLPLGSGVPTGAVPLPPPSTAVDVEPEYVPTPTAAPKGDGGARRRFMLIGSLVLVLVAALVYFGYQNRGRFFPNAREEAPVTQAAEDPIARATRLHEEGRTDVALNTLRRMPPVAPRYAEAQALISQWEAAEQAEVAAAEEEAALAAAPVVDLEQRQALLDEAELLFAGGESIAARELLDEAEAMAPFEGDDLQFERSVDQALEPLARFVALFEGGDYEFGLPDLWRMHATDPDNLDIRRLITGSYYNLAVTDLQRGDAEAAYGKLEEALSVTPGDLVLERHQRFAEAYRDQSKDLQYRIYVKYLPVR